MAGRQFILVSFRGLLSGRVHDPEVHGPFLKEVNLIAKQAHEHAAMRFHVALELSKIAWPDREGPGGNEFNKEKNSMLSIGAFFAPLIVGTPLIQILVTLVVVGVLLWLVNLIPMQSTIKSILNTIVVIIVVLWLLQVFGLFTSLSNIRVGH